MILNILTPSGSLVSNAEVSAVFLPGELGEFEVLGGHAPIISSLTGGMIRYREGGEEKSVTISSGFAIVKDDRIEACVEK